MRSAECLGNIRLPYRHFERKREIFVIRSQELTLSLHVPHTSPLSSSVFHTACALSAPSGHLPLEGKADDARIAFAQDDEMRRTTPLNLFCSIYRQYAL